MAAVGWRDSRRRLVQWPESMVGANGQRIVKLSYRCRINSLGHLARCLASISGIDRASKRQEAERSRSMLREKLEEISITIEDFRDGAQLGLTDIFEFSLTGRLREGQTGMKKLPRLDMLVRFTLPA